MNLKKSQYQAIMRQYDLRQLQHRHLQSQRYQEICDRLPAYRQLEEETASFCADRARAAALGRKDVLQDMQQQLQEQQRVARARLHVARGGVRGGQRVQEGLHGAARVHQVDEERAGHRQEGLVDLADHELACGVALATPTQHEQVRREHGRSQTVLGTRLEVHLPLQQLRPLLQVQPLAVHVQLAEVLRRHYA